MPLVELLEIVGHHVFSSKHSLWWYSTNVILIFTGVEDVENVLLMYQSYMFQAVSLTVPWRNYNYRQTLIYISQMSYK